jgi:conjugal transfer pilus assembly protein TraD
MPWGVKARILAALAGMLFLLSAGLVGIRGERLPGGAFAPFAAALFLLAALPPLGWALRLHLLSRRLRTPRRLVLEARAIPVRPGFTFLGQGFEWGPEQTKLLEDLTAASPPEGVPGDWLLHGLGADRWKDLFLPNEILNEHLFLMGAPGSGKTRALELLIEQAVARGDAVVVIDPKGDEALLDRVYDSAVRHGRRDAFRVIALPYPYRSARYNPLGDYLAPTDIADRIASGLPRGGESEAFRNFAWEFVHKVACAFHLLGEPITLSALENAIFHSPWELVRRLLRKACPDLPQAREIEPTLDLYRDYCRRTGVVHPELDALIEMASLDRKHFAKISGSLRTLLSKLTWRHVAYLLSPGAASPPEGVEVPAAAPVLSWRSIDRDRLVVYFFLGSLIGQDTAAATARMALADLASYVGKKYAFEEARSFAAGRLTVVVDEVADAISEPSVNLLNKARGAGLSLILAGQSLADLEVALGGRAEARRALANVGTFLAFRAANPEDAAYVSDKVGRRALAAVTRGEHYEPALFSSGRSHIADFAYSSSVSISTRSEPLLPTSVLDRLGRFHFFGLWGGELRKGLLPLLEPPRRRFSSLLKLDLPLEDEEAGT